MKTKIEFTRVNNDVNGNPRYVCHFLNYTVWSIYERFDEDFDRDTFQAQSDVVEQSYIDPTSPAPADNDSGTPPIVEPFPDPKGHAAWRSMLAILFPGKSSRQCALSLSPILGLSAGTIANQTSRTRPLPSWAKAMLFAYNQRADLDMVRKEMGGEMIKAAQGVFGGKWPGQPDGSDPTAS